MSENMQKETNEEVLVNNNPSEDGLINKESSEMIVKNKKSKLPKIITGVVILAIILIALIIAVPKAMASSNIKRLIDKADKYLDELDYENAIAAYKEAMELDPKNADAYIGLAYAYIGINEFDTALEWAQKGYDITKDERLKEIIDMISSGNIVDKRGMVHRDTGYDGAGNVQFHFDYTYLKDGKIESLSRLDASGTVRYVLMYEYDGDLMTVGRFGYENDGSAIIPGHYSYDENGRETRIEEYTEAGEYRGAIEFEYNEAGERTKETRYDTDNKITNIAIQEHDGDSYTEYRYTADMELISSLRSYTDADGNYRYDYFDPNGNLLFYTITFVENGRYTKYVSYTPDGTITQIVEYN